MQLNRSYALVLLCVACVCVESARAQLVVHTASVSGMPVPGGAGTVIPPFDPDYGVLRWVEVRVVGSVSGTLALENTTSAPAANGVYYVGANIATSVGSFTFPPTINPAFESDQYTPVPPPMAAFDGTLDFQGTSSTTYTFALQSGSGGPSQTYAITNASEFAPWIGPAGGGPLLPFQFQAADFGFGFLATGVMETHALTADVHLTVKYGYEPLPAPICRPAIYFACPCGVPQQLLDRGCANSASGGALLSIAGTPSFNNDTLQLQGSGMPDGPALYFQGDAFNYGSIAFGDGLLCVTGSIVRLGIKFNLGGASSYPEAGDPSVSVQGGIIGPALGCYQIYYRDAAAYCTSATFNLSNGYALQWVP
jgi:hypothetical protein